MAQLQFNTTTGVEVPEVSDVRDDIAQAVQEAFQTSPTDPLINVEPTTPMGQIVDAMTAEVSAKKIWTVFYEQRNCCIYG